MTQPVPIREVYLTSERTRKLKLGGSEVLVKHAPRWMLALASARARLPSWMAQAIGKEAAQMT